ncbi:MAG TPA: tyrosine-type recombinase/integrase [Bryobacteraceae bacterium]|nr:tyrosine-type recombinase/integrase [Bryobacteraceae bacterium]
MINVNNIGRCLGRARHENGWVEKVGKRVKKWRGYYHVYASLAGGCEKRLRRKITLGDCSSMTKGEAEDKLRDHIKESRGQRVATGSDAMVSTLCDDYFRMRKGDWCEPGTTHAVLEHLIKPAVGHMRIGDVEAEDLKAMINSLPGRRWATPKGGVKTGCSHSYAKKCITYTKGIFDLAIAKGLIRMNPARDPIVKLTMPKGVRQPDKSYLKPEGIPLLLTRLNVEDHVIIHIALVCALRPNEIFALRRNDVGDGWIVIDESLDRRRSPKDPKTHSSKARVSVPPLLRRELDAWLSAHTGAPDDLLFPNRDGRPKNRQNELNRMLKPAAKRAGLGRVTFQMLRRTFSTLVQVTAGLKDIQAQMRHARPDTTAAIYMQAIPAQQERAIRVFEEMIFGSIEGALQ